MNSTERTTLIACAIAGAAIGAIAGLSYTAVAGSIIASLMTIIVGYLTIADATAAADDASRQARTAGIVTGWRRLASLAAAIAIAAIVAAQFRAPADADSSSEGNLVGLAKLRGLMSSGVLPEFCSADDTASLSAAIVASKDETLMAMLQAIRDEREGATIEKLQGAQQLICAKAAE